MVKMIKLPSLMEYLSMSDEERKYWDELRPFIGYVNPHSKSDLVPLYVTDDPYEIAEIRKHPACDLDFV